jgi:hypothetical protein
MFNWRTKCRHPDTEYQQTATYKYNDNKRQKYKRRGNLDRCNGLERSILNVYFRISKTMSTALLKLHVPVELTPPPRRSSRDVRRLAYSPELCACYFEQLLSWEHLRVALTAILGTRDELSADVLRTVCCLEDVSFQMKNKQQILKAIFYCAHWISPICFSIQMPSSGVTLSLQVTPVF